LRNEDEIIRDALSWEGTPYVSGAGVKGVGVDCGYFLRRVYEPYYGPFPPTPRYAPDWALHSDQELYLDFIMPYVREVPQVRRGGFTLYHVGLRYAHAAIWDGQNTSMLGVARATAPSRAPRRA
jgi:cell wall-associated NlpC family hydrolase